ncbi:MAG: hypothetical protein WBV82_19340 [Myxococcaceae bacterium]
MTSLVLALWLAAAPGQAPGAGERAPGVAAPVSLRVHVTASEDLDPDALRALSRPGVVLWLRTRSNALRTSTVERLARFGEAYVELRSPVSQRQVEQLRRVPAAGIWGRGRSLRTEDLTRVGMRRVAWSTSGALDELESTWRAFHPVRVRWGAPQQVVLAAWARLGQLPGAVTVSLPPGEVPSCEERAEGVPGGRSVRFVARSPDEARSLARCGFGVVLVVEPSASAPSLLELFREIPFLELEVDVGADVQKARVLRALIEGLGRAP